MSVADVHNIEAVIFGQAAMDVARTVDHDIPDLNAAAAAGTRLSGAERVGSKIAGNMDGPEGEGYQVVGVRWADEKAESLSGKAVLNLSPWMEDASSLSSGSSCLRTSTFEKMKGLLDR